MHVYPAKQMDANPGLSAKRDETKIKRRKSWEIQDKTTQTEPKIQDIAAGLSSAYFSVNLNRIQVALIQDNLV